MTGKSAALANFPSYFSVHDVPKDGSCLFAAIAQQLVSKNYTRKEVTAADVRRELIEYIRSSDELKARITDRLVNQTLDNYLLSMSSVKAWGDENMLYAAALYYDVTIHIWRSGVEVPTVIGSSTENYTVDLGYVSSLTGEQPTHYVSLLTAVGDESETSSISRDTVVTAPLSEDTSNQWKTDRSQCTDEDVSETSVLGHMEGSSENVTLCHSPNQPDIKYPKNSYGRCFNYEWYRKWPWLHWDERKSAVLCHPCSIVASMSTKLLCKKLESTFSVDGFTNWRDPGRAFNKHERSAQHKESLLRWTSYCKKMNVAAQLNSQICQEQEKNRAVLMKILTSIRFLARQGLAVRGHSDDTGNYRELLKLRSDDVENLRSWFGRKRHYLSHDVQNEMLNLMSQHLLRRLLADVKKNAFYSVICDEVTDEARQQHLGISVRWVDSEFAVSEDFLGLYAITKADAKSLAGFI